MPRRTTTALVAVSAALALGACSGRTVDSQGAEDRAEEILTTRDVGPLDQDAAGDAASCIADGMFNDTEVLQVEERNEVLLALDGTVPPEDLVERVRALVESCGALPDGAGGSGGSDEPDAADTGGDDGEDEGSTTTTEG